MSPTAAQPSAAEVPDASKRRRYQDSQDGQSVTQGKAETYRMRSACGEHERVVGEGLAVDVDLLAFRVDVIDLAQENGDVLVPPQDAPDRLGDLARRQHGGGHLVQERLEEVVVAAVDHRYAQGGAPQGLRKGKPCEPATNDHDVV